MSFGSDDSISAAKKARAEKIAETKKAVHNRQRLLLRAIQKELKDRDSVSESFLRSWWDKNKWEAYNMAKEEENPIKLTEYWVTVFRWLSYEQDGGKGFNRNVTSLKHLINCENQYIAAMRDAEQFEAGQVTAGKQPNRTWDVDITTAPKKSSKSKSSDVDAWSDF